jgi:quercetin dioxygenase-like cupin family protein
MQKVTPADVAEGLTEFWSQQVIGSANGSLFKVAKGIGSTTWHTHEDQEETFLILRGQLTIQLRSGDPFSGLFLTGGPAPRRVPGSRPPPCHRR